MRGFVPIGNLRAKPMVPAHARPPDNPAGPRPRWLLAPAAAGKNYERLRRLTRELRLHTVCESARLSECRGLLEPSQRDVHDPW